MFTHWNSSPAHAFSFIWFLEMKRARLLPFQPPSAQVPSAEGPAQEPPHTSTSNGVWVGEPGALGPSARLVPEDGADGWAPRLGCGSDRVRWEPSGCTPMTPPPELCILPSRSTWSLVYLFLSRYSIYNVMTFIVVYLYTYLLFF